MILMLISAAIDIEYKKYLALASQLLGVIDRSSSAGKALWLRMLV
jgi:hypothetical protein